MKINASDALIKTLINNGLEVVFANPGTSEMHLVAAIDHNPQVRPVLGLFEGVVSGAADGYARMSAFAKSLAWSKESFTPSIKIYSIVIVFRLLCVFR